VRSHGGVVPAIALVSIRGSDASAPEGDEPILNSPSGRIAFVVENSPGNGGSDAANSDGTGHKLLHDFFLAMRLLVLPMAFLFTALSCGYDLPTAAVEETGGAPRTSWMSARVEGEPWNPVFVKAQRLTDYLILEGTAWIGDEATLVIRLEIKAVAGASPQVIDSSSTILANVVYDPVYQARQSWTASGTMGSGTFLVSSLSATGAAGTFSFTARALTANSVPRDYRVTDGTFVVSF
jgi:hypothetical protein